MARGKENLKPARAKDEARKRGAAGGKKSGEARREKKALRERMKLLVDGKQADGTDTRDALAKKILDKALGGDLRAAEMVMNMTGESMDAVNFTLPRNKDASLPDITMTVLRRLAEGKISPKDASSIAVVLGTHIQAVKTSAELMPEDPTGGDYMTVSDEEMEARIRARQLELEAQREGLPARREEMHSLYGMVDDPFFSSSAKRNETATDNDDGK